jgi:3-dehydroquinate synthase
MKFDFKFTGPEQFVPVTQLLEEWFKGQFSRNSVLPFRSSQTKPNDACLAAALFKRGAAGLYDAETGSYIYPSPPAETFEIAKPVFFKSWSDFFAKHILVRKDLQKTIFVADQTLLHLHPHLESDLAQTQAKIYVLKCTEEDKTLSSVAAVCSAAGAECNSMIIIGGGICCDTAALAGALLQLRITLVPTTLLSLVDAGIGGKTGVNHAQAGKNQIGTFASIDEIICVYELLQTLQPALVCDGLAEILKHSWLCGRFEQWKPAIEKLLSMPSGKAFAEKDVQTLICENINFKRIVVQFDPFEKNVRVLLNLGHTIAHLLEALHLRLQSQNFSLFPLSHGMAVLQGLRCLAENGLIQSPPSGFQEIIKRIQYFQKIPQPLFQLGEYSEVAKTLLLQDKKNTHSPETLNAQQVRCILPAYGALGTLPRPESAQEFTDDCVAYILPEDLLRHMTSSGIIR